MGAEAGLLLSATCDEGAGSPCDEDAPSVAWRPGKSQLYFTSDGEASAEPSSCGAEGEHSTLLVPVVSDEGGEATLIVHAQRWVSAPGVSRRGTRLDDATPWLAVANAEQGMRAWLPGAPNSGLPDGRWRTAQPMHVYVWARHEQLSLSDESLDAVPLSIDLHKRAVGCYTGNSAEYDGGLATTASGRTCQEWASDMPHGHGIHELPANFCRNTHGNSYMWCYTTDPDMRWEYCAQIPTCPSPPSPPVQPPPPTLPALANLGEECWRSCNGQSGPCVTGFCGAEGLCCRIGYDEHLFSCGFGTLGCENMGHCCVAPQGEDEASSEGGQYCMSTDDGATDSYGDGCTVYDDYPGFCNGYDDDDFTSAFMCCACGGGAMVDALPPASPAMNEDDPYVYDPYVYDPYVYTPPADGEGFDPIPSTSPMPTTTPGPGDWMG